MPVFIISGSLDRHTTIAETRKLFEHAAPPKELWIVEGAGHVDLYNFSPTIYEKKILTYFDKYLGSLGR